MNKHATTYARMLGEARYFSYIDDVIKN